MAFQAWNTKGDECWITEYPGTETASVSVSGVGSLWAYRVYTSTYIDTNGDIYSNMEDKLKKYDNNESRVYAFKKLKELGLM